MLADCQHFFDIDMKPDISICYSKSGNLNAQVVRRLENQHPSLYAYIMAQYPLYTRLQDKLKALRDGDYLHCYTCGKVMPYPRKRPEGRVYCSRECGNNSPYKKEAIKDNYHKSAEKRKQTNLRRYGVEHIWQSPVMQAKGRETLQARYGVNNPYQLPSVKQNAHSAKSKQKSSDKTIQNKKDYVASLGIDTSGLVIDWKNLKIGHPSKRVDKEMVEVALGLRPATVEIIRRNYVHAYPVLHDYGLLEDFVSCPQKIISEYLDKSGIQYIQNSRSIIPPKELDIYIPDRNLAIEVNGVYYHDTLVDTPKMYHLDKFNLTLDKNIRLLQFWDYEILYRQGIVENVVAQELGLLPSIREELCKVKRVYPSSAKSFYHANSLLFFIDKNTFYGIYHQGKLVACCMVKQVKDCVLMRDFCGILGTAVSSSMIELLANHLRTRYNKPVAFEADKRFLPSWIDKYPAISTVLPQKTYVLKSDSWPINLKQDSDLNPTKHHLLYDCGATQYLILQ